MTLDWLHELPDLRHPERIAPGAWLLPGAAAMPELLDELPALLAVSPWRQVMTPGGRPMSVWMSNCGDCGWVSDRRGYRYEPLDPLTGKPWPAMPPAFSTLATRLAAQAGYAGFAPDACLLNRYLPGARMSLHQDRDEADFSQPIVSVSLGLPATFQFSGLRRGDPLWRARLHHGDVVVWGGPSRLYHHGVLALEPGHHPLLGEQRINLTFRRAR